MNLFAKAKAAKEKRGSKKGFTLVELIVVLVILAILMAILVPALVKWIDRAKDKQVLIDARTAYLAAQTITSEEYATTSADGALLTAIQGKYDEILELAQVDGTIAITGITSGKVQDMTYTTKDGGKTVSMVGGVWQDVLGTNSTTTAGGGA